MMSRLTACIIAVATIVSIGSGLAHEFQKARSRSTSVVRAIPGGAQVATGYLTIENDGAKPDRTCLGDG